MIHNKIGVIMLYLLWDYIYIINYHSSEWMEEARLIKSSAPNLGFPLEPEVPDGSLFPALEGDMPLSGHACPL